MKQYAIDDWAITVLRNKTAINFDYVKCFIIGKELKLK